MRIYDIRFSVIIILCLLNKYQTICSQDIKELCPLGQITPIIFNLFLHIHCQNLLLCVFFLFNKKQFIDLSDFRAELCLSEVVQIF